MSESNCGNCSLGSRAADGRNILCADDGRLWPQEFFCGAHKPTTQGAQEVAPAFNTSGSKYLRKMIALVDGCADVYAVIVAFAVTCPARQHAIKKLLCTGLRGKGDSMQDLKEARDAIDRAMQLEAARIAEGSTP
jgi:hypothetical protein